MHPPAHPPSLPQSRFIGAHRANSFVLWWLYGILNLLFLSLSQAQTVIGWGDFDQTTIPEGLNGVVSVAAGDAHALALKNDGTVVAWGANDYGQSTVPVGLGGIVAISGGAEHSLALRADGTVVAWGRNDYGQTTVPPSLSSVIAISAGHKNSMALKRDGTVVLWGFEYTDYQGLPTDDPSRPPPPSGVTAIAAGWDFSLAMKSDGTVVSWGILPASNTLSGCVSIAGTLEGALALKADGSVDRWFYGWTLTTPTDLSGVVAVAAGEFHTLALKHDGTVDGRGNQFAIPLQGDQGLINVGAIAAGGDHSLAIVGINGAPPQITSAALARATPAGPDLVGESFYYRILATGAPTSYGATGLPQGLAVNPGTGAITGTPTEAGEFNVTLSATNANGSGTRSLQIYVSGLPVVLNSSALVQTTPLNANFNFTLHGANGGTWSAANLPPGISINALTGVLSGVPIEPGTFAATISLQNSFGTTSFDWTVEIATVVSWGDLKNAGTQVPAGLTGVVAISAGSYNWALALKSDGTVVDWGYEHTTVPAGLSGVVAISAGSGHSLALKLDGTVVAWGNNLSGQATVPTGLAEVIAISAGEAHSLALKRDGTVVAWGEDYPEYPPMSANLSGVVAISAGANHSLALKSDGTVVGWGWNNGGELDIPAGLNNVVAIEAGAGHSCALKSDGTVVAWGDLERPRTVLSEVTAIATAWMGYFTLALKSDGTLIQSPYSDIYDTLYTRMPSGLTGVAAISMGAFQSLALIGAHGHIPQIISAALARANPSGFGAGGEPFYYRIMATGSPTNYGATGLPLGLTVNANTGVITGTPTEVGQFNVTLSATNAAGTGTRALQIYVSGLPVVLNSPTSLGTVPLTVPFHFTLLSANGGTWSATNLPPGISLNSITGELSGIPIHSGSFNSTISVQNGFGTNTILWQAVVTPVVVWGRDYYNPEQKPVPFSLGDAIAVAAAGYNRQVLKSDGTVMGWGDDQFYHSYENVPPPEGLNGVVGIAAAVEHSLALKSNGTVVAWGRNQYGETTVPDGLDSVVAIAASWHQSIALKQNGTVVTWGYGTPRGQFTVPGLINIVAIASLGYGKYSALKSDGTVLTWNGSSIPGYGHEPRNIIEGLDVVSLGSSVALLRSGVAVPLPGGAMVPPSLVDVIAIADYESHVLAVKRDGTVVSWGGGSPGPEQPPAGLSGVGAVSTAGYTSLAIAGSNLDPPRITSPALTRAAPSGHGLSGEPFYYQIMATSTPAIYGATGLPLGLAVNANTGVITGTPTEVGHFNVTLSATNAAGTGTRSLQIYVSGLPVVIPTSSRELALGVPFELTFRVDHGSNWAATNLPPGLTLNPTTGTLSGTPTGLGLFDVTISVQNGFGTSYTHWFALVSILGQSSATRAVATVGTSFSYQIAFTGVPLPAYPTYTAWGLPIGLTMDRQSGVIFGKPLQSGVFEVGFNADYPPYLTGRLVLTIWPKDNLAAQEAYAAWRDAHWSAGAGLTAPTDDADGDGQPNLLEFASGTDPLASNASMVQSQRLEDGRLELTLRVPTNVADFLLVKAEFAPDLAFGPDMDEAAPQISLTSTEDFINYRFVQTTQPQSGKNCFGRIRVLLPQ